MQIVGNRSNEEIQKTLDNYEEVYSELEAKHEEVTMLIEDEAQFEEEERWIEQCQETFLRLKIDAQDYMKQQTLNNIKTGSTSKPAENSPPEAQGSNIETPAAEENDALTPNEGIENIGEIPTTVLTQEDQGNNVQPNALTNDSFDSAGNTGVTAAHVNHGQSLFRIEKPKMPKFAGDVREFGTFRADFKHLVETRYSKRDAVTILRSSLQGKPLEMIKGIGQDYDAAWEYLNSVYGDPRFVADIITQDISKFKAIKDGEDARFCDLVHLVKRSFNTLKEVGRENDMNNNHMLAIIEQKLSSDDRKHYHHPLLHNANKPVVSSVTTSGETMLPTIQMEILGSHNIKKQVNVLLDTGAQISLIRTSVAEELGLKGKTVTITMAKVGGEENEMAMKMYRIRMRSLENQSIHTITAVGIPSISNDVSVIKLDNVAETFGLSREKLRRKNGPVDILLGIDHPKLHTGETKEAGSLVARQSPLGWVVFGATSDERLENVSQVFHVKCSNPIDMSDFWTTESMGVEGKMCSCETKKLSAIEAYEAKIIESSCQKVGSQWLVPYPWIKDATKLPDNRSQAEKKLEATERRLAMNPTHAEAYNKQMEEMTEMNFSRKIIQRRVKVVQRSYPLHIAPRNS